MIGLLGRLKVFIGNKINGTRIAALNVHRDGFYDLNLARGVYNLKVLN